MQETTRARALSPETSPALIATLNDTEAHPRKWQLPYPFGPEVAKRTLQPLPSSTIVRRSLLNLCYMASRHTLKKALILVLVLVGVVCAGVAVVLIKLDTLVKGLRPAIEQELSKLLGSKVTCGDISASVIPKIHLEVSDLRVEGADAQTLACESVALSTALTPLLSGTARVTDLTVMNPVLTVVKAADGISISGLPQKNASPMRDNSPVSSPTSQTEGAGPSSPLELDLQRFGLRGGRFALLGFVPMLERPLTLSHVQLDATGSVKDRHITIPAASGSAVVDGAGSVSFSAKGVSHSLEGGLPVFENVSFTTAAGVFSLTSPGVDKPWGLSSEGVTLEKLLPVALSFVPSVKSVADLQPKGAVTLSSQLSLPGVKSALLETTSVLSLSGASVKLPEERIISNISAKCEIESKGNSASIKINDLMLTSNGEAVTASLEGEASPLALAIKKLSYQGLGGQGTIDAKIELGQEPQFASQISASGLSIERVVKAAQIPIDVRVTGTLSSFKGAATGVAGPRLGSTVNATGEVQIAQGRLKGVNIAAVVLDKVDAIPFLKGSLLSLLPPPLQPAVSNPDTVIHTLSSSYSLQGGRVTIGALELASDTFTLRSKGYLETSGKVNLDATISFTESFSAGLCALHPDLTKILDSQKRLTFPLTILGTAPNIIVTPNLAEILQLAAKRLAKDKALDLLDKTIGDRIPGGPGVKRALEGVLGW
jgi:hypothetical protein